MVKLSLKRLRGFTRTRWNLVSKRSNKIRKLEIGPGHLRKPGYETLNIDLAPNVDYMWDAALTLPFSDNTFCEIYASHVFEHMPWYKLDAILKEWVRVLSPKGTLEIWVPNGLKIIEAFIAAEKHNDNSWKEDNWYRFNEQNDPCVWANGRIFTYGDGTGEMCHPNWHKALFSPRYLELLFKKVGLIEITTLTQNPIKEDDHGWINLGMRGIKP